MLTRELNYGKECTALDFINITAFWRQFHNSKPLLYLVFLSIEKGVPPQVLEVIGDETNTREEKR
ncbi:hypothetical protein R70331_09585 [Paenibacillus sp. FSL R7-0331]|nr:hypothetical protein R70331_09585 [Paenibacillus sp. FSL R7-0331]